MKKSFYDWCIENNRVDLLDRWDYNVNNVDGDKFVTIALNNSNEIVYYRKLGYDIPQRFNNQKHKYTTPYGTEMNVKIKDLPENKLVGQRFGKVVVMMYDFSKTNESKKKKTYLTYWICMCDCGNVVSIEQENLLTDKSKSCGCEFYRKPENLIGLKFGHLTVVGYDDKKSNDRGKCYWLCQCDCGNQELVSVVAFSLKNGDTKSCGCLWKQSITGENNYNWSGGITPVISWLRNKIRPWVIDTFSSYDSKCLVTGKHADVVHHLINFHTILYNVLDELCLPIYDDISKYTQVEMDKLSSLFIEKHYTLNCGIPLTTDVHNCFHKMYGYKNNTIDQFVDFLERIKNNEIDIGLTESDESYKTLIDDAIHKILNS